MAAIWCGFRPEKNLVGRICNRKFQSTISIQAITGGYRNGFIKEVTKQDSKFADRQPWTKEEDYRLLEMRQADVSVPDICIALNRSFGSVETRLSRKGGGLRNIKSTEILRKQWTAVEVAKLQEMRAAGRDLFEIATSLGRTESAVYLKLMKFGVGKKTALSEAKPRLQATKVAKVATKKLGRDEEGIRECLKCRGPFL